MLVGVTGLGSLAPLFGVRNAAATVKHVAAPCSELALGQPVMAPEPDSSAGSRRGCIR